MASPQKENGYTPIANEVLEALIRAGMAGSELAIVLAIIRMTWGWGRKEAEISLGDMIKATKLTRTTVARALSDLVSDGVVIVIKGGGRGMKSKWSLNKDWEQWKTVPSVGQKKTVPKINSTENGTVSVPKMGLFMCKNGTVSGCNPLSAQEHQSPKESIKERKEKNASHSGQKDPTYEHFAGQFLAKRGVPYQQKTGDFVRLAALRKTLGIEGKKSPQNWESATANFFATPMGRYTLADLCSRFDTFLISSLDRFGQPPESALEPPKAKPITLADVEIHTRPDGTQYATPKVKHVEV